MQLGSVQFIEIEGRRVEYRVRSSPSARRLRILVGVGGVDVVKPQGRQAKEVEQFLLASAKWLLSQIERATRLRSMRRVHEVEAGHILFKGAPTAVVVSDGAQRGGPNLVRWDGARIVVLRGKRAAAGPAQSLENWLRRRAREAFERELNGLVAKVKVAPRRIYVMGQRTKWGNCSALKNLSFNWRLIMAPECVLQYIVTHEAVHLVIPDHSAKFWLTVQSHCREAERAKQWLAANGRRLHEPIVLLGERTAAGTEGAAHG